MGRMEKESRVAAVAAIMLMTAAGAFSEEKLKRASTQAAAEKLARMRRIVVSIPDRKLALLEGSLIVRIWATAVGAESTPTPIGTYTVVNRLIHPVYYRPGKIVPAGVSNPLGTRWLGLSLKGFGIHGTNSPRSIGRKASHGCIRMRNQDVEELFELVSTGDVVELHGERDEVLTQIFSPSIQ